ncbi:30S ribosomal subunit protein S2 [Candidatus Xenohaliotis californiensis]|uniref:Small ribosomal subunit protein uS2 n=1 Tax=Candidatus Xenohaliotis californiensis TaxID=84677 RepID=A0ABP0ET18_9RICK|nr:30S ribosomal subunit protein S2 [Candidatus Xenohaliotis californiensis]
MGQVPQFTMRELFNASVHMGHKTMFRNPLMTPYIYGEMNTVHIIDLKKSFGLLHSALEAMHNCVSKGGRILFVATKYQASGVVKDEAKRCGQYYITKRWLGGLFTNWSTISLTIKNMEKMRATLQDPDCNLVKKELMQMQRKLNKMEEYFGGIIDLGRLPDMIFVIDAVRESLAIKEASKIGIPIVAILDTNADPRLVNYPIPGNDDSMRAIKLYCRLAANSIVDGIKDSVAMSKAAELEKEVAINDDNLSKSNQVLTKKEPKDSKISTMNQNEK